MIVLAPAVVIGWLVYPDHAVYVLTGLPVLSVSTDRPRPGVLPLLLGMN